MSRSPMMGPFGAEKVSDPDGGDFGRLSASSPLFSPIARRGIAMYVTVFWAGAATSPNGICEIPTLPQPQALGQT
jgi:hypothetical protein